MTNAPGLDSGPTSGRSDGEHSPTAGRLQEIAADCLLGCWIVVALLIPVGVGVVSYPVLGLMAVYTDLCMDAPSAASSTGCRFVLGWARVGSVAQFVLALAGLLVLAVLRGRGTGRGRLAGVAGAIIASSMVVAFFFGLVLTGSS